MEISQLNKRRGALKQRLSGFNKYIKKLQSNSDEIENSYQELILRIEKNENILHEFNEIQNDIENLTLEDQINTQYAERENFETQYYEILGIAKTLLNVIQSANSADVDTNDSASTHRSETQSTHDNNNIHSENIKLPTIRLPKFSGVSDEWLEFKDTFESLIHDNSAINTIQKFHYLRACLEGASLQVVQSLEFSASNYQLAWDLLNNRYNNPKSLVKNHINAILNLPMLQKENSTNIRKLVDKIQKHIRSLEILKQPVDKWDTILITIIVDKLDKFTAKEWETLNQKPEFPTIKELNDFLLSRATLVESLESREKGSNPNESKVQKFNPKKEHSLIASNYVCYLCEENHPIYNCPEFLKLTPQDRCNKVESKNLCKNCLRPNHLAKECKSSNCRTCNKKHNTLLHFHKQASEDQAKDVSLNCITIKKTGQVMLSTARVKVKGNDNKFYYCKALLDSGSQSNFITQDFAEKLGVKQFNSNISLIGINSKTSQVKKQCNLTIFSTNSNYQATIQCYVLSTITGRHPVSDFEKSSIKIPDFVKLADNHFNTPENIDLLIGASLFWQLILNGNISLGENQPTIQNTKLGWIISGTYTPASDKFYCNLSIMEDSNNELQNQLKTFWELEEVNSLPYNHDHFDCNAHFTKTYTRNDEGRFIVRIPFNSTTKDLGNSITLAKKRFHSLENRFNSDSQFKVMYSNFMKEYENLGHMSKVGHLLELANETQYLLPHHGVVREDKVTTKLRVVFDGSAITDSGKSLNQTQAIGPTIQNDLLSIILRFRKYAYVVSADIKQMYRQVLVHPDDRKFQRIIWRFNQNDPLSVYDLNTVTYGTASAPYLAIRCLDQLSREFELQYPKACNTIRKDFYVDDLLTGHDDEKVIIQLCKQIDQILKSGGFQLCKWISNKRNIISTLTSELPSAEHLVLGSDDTKTLGVCWSSTSDSFYYNVPKVNQCCPITKRTMLSRISKLFDPMGLLGPCIIITKLLIQKLWLLKLDWDEEIPEELLEQWTKFDQELHWLNHLRIPRQVLCKNAKKLEIHGFCDSSQTAYGACVYIRSFDKNETIQVHLLCAKSRVTPQKLITIPRLELCGALLLARLISRAQLDLKIEADIYYWCDSQVTLHWINTPPNLLQTFVANRVSNILILSQPKDWYYVRSKENPADHLTRGLFPKSLVNTNCWWNGPHWLKDKSHRITKFVHSKSNIEIPELKPNIQLCNLTQVDEALYPFERFSDLTNLIRVTALVLRFKNNCLYKNNKQTDDITINEYNEAQKRLIKMSQERHFASEIRALMDKKCLNNKSKILALTPFLDTDGLLRVGGRLQFSKYSYDKKHPYLISNKHWFADLILTNEHIRLLHAGPQQILSSSRETFWILSGRNTAKRIVRKCIKCFRFKPKSITPLMGTLPASRVDENYPFYCTGIDYAGTFQINDKRGRGSKQIKCYICVFVCMSTKCIHLEAVTDLTTENFIAVLRRFTSRRGLPSHIYSDNGKNFIGANKELKILGEFLQNHKNSIITNVAKLNITWHFIPPYSPHFGGLWEAGVKSTKFHLKRTLSLTSLAYEEFVTVLVQIEAVLNSRPLSPISTDPNDLHALTPGHLLIGRSLTSVANPDVTEINHNRLSRYQYIQKLQQQFWERWRKDYLNELQMRTKWKTSQEHIQEGTMVIIKEDHLPPLCWKLGRVISLHPGQDGVIRVVSIKTSTGVIKRTMTKICPLPLDD